MPEPRVLSLEIKLPLFIGALLVLVVTAFSWKVYVEVRNSALRTAGTRLEYVSKQIEGFLGGSGPRRTEDARQGAASPALVAYLRYPASRTRAAALQALQRIAFQDSLKVAIELWTSADERVLAVGRPFLALDTTTAHVLSGLVSSSHPAAIGLLRSIGGSLFFSVVAAVGDSSDPAGYLVTWRPVVATPGAGRQIAQLIGPNAAFEIGNARGDVWTDLAREVDGPPVDMGQRRGVLEYERAGGGRYLANIAPIGGTPWVLVVEIPYDPVLAPVRGVLARLVIVGVVLIVAGTAGAWQVSRRLTGPLRGQERRAEGRFRAVVESTPSGVLMVDRAGRIVLVNRETERLFGYGRDELIGRPIELLVPQRVHDGHPGLRATFFAKPQTRAMGAGRDLHGVRKDGTELPVEIGLNPIETDEGLFVLASVVDISARKRAEARFRTAVESAPNGMVMIDRGGKIILVNREIERLFGYGREELLGQPIERLVPQRLRERHPGLRTAFFEHPQTRSMGAGRDLFGVRKDGVEIPVEIGLNPIETDEGLFVLASVVDISARKRAEEELRRSNAELERFAYVASHDLQEPLRMVGNYVQLLGKRYKGRLDSDADEFIGFALDGALRMQRLIEDLLAYSRVGTRGTELAPTDAAAALERALTNLTLAIAEAGAVVTHDPLPVVAGDPGQLEHVFLNLIGNALKFRGDQPPQVHVTSTQVDGEWRFSVRDNGIGIDPQYFDRIFVIFQRLHAREEYPGTGIGLAITKRIIERHGGRIWVESQPGQGATFSFTLPTTRESA
jgi:PAS domain S-box-containing protein